MGHLHRFYARHAAAIWELEGRWMTKLGVFRRPEAVQWLVTSSCLRRSNSEFTHISILSSSASRSWISAVSSEMRSSRSFFSTYQSQFCCSASTLWMARHVS